MLFRQLFHRDSSTYTYLLASQRSGRSILIDPVREDIPGYGRLLDELGLSLAFAVDTHVHADHITALGDLRERTDCVTVMGEQSAAHCVSRKVRDGDVLEIDGVRLEVRHTPGHTDDSYSFLLSGGPGPATVFTGDTLLIRGTGRTDFQNGDARAQYNSIFGRLLTLPDSTLVYPGHDYKGWTVSTIGEERAHNPRLQVSSIDEYVELMNNLNLPSPKLMDLAVPANRACGRAA